VLYCSPNLFTKLLQFILIQKTITIVFVQSTLSAQSVGYFVLYSRNKLMENRKDISQEGAYWIQLAQDRDRLGFV
jgi:hypothetical protein